MNNNTIEKTFELYIQQAEESDFSGWDFSYLVKTSRMKETHQEWNYYNLLYPYLVESETMLDMGTGGGENLSILKPLPPKTIATELYKPNIETARNRLEPLGIEVVSFEGKGPSGYEEMPFDDDYFDLVINSHESYFPPELMRILKPGGVFVTQQVGSENLVSLVEFLTGQDYSTDEWDLKVAAEELTASGFSILSQQENIFSYRFYDVGAIAWLFKALPWMIEEYDIGKYKDKLWELHLGICEKGYYDTQCHRFAITCRA